jgi:antitoxin ParD1/3/4
MDQMNVSITEHLAGYVRAKVASGRYNNASEVVRDALRRMEDADLHFLVLKDSDREDLHADLSEGELAKIRTQIADSDAQIERGECTEYEGDEGLRKLASEIKAEGRAELLRAKAG